MSFVWVQQWFALPVALDDPMGDASSESGPEPARSALQHATCPPDKPSADTLPSVAATSFQPHYPNRSLEVQRLPHQQQHQQHQHQHQHQHHAYAYSMPPGQAPASASFNMAAMNAALPDYTSTMPGPAPVQSPHQPQRGISGASTSAVVYQLQQISQYPPAAMGYPSQPAYAPSYGTSQFSPPYPSFAPPQQRAMAHAQLPQPFMQYPQAQPYMYYPGPFSQPPVAYAYPQLTQRLVPG
ncbi:hypothetical protein SLS58_009916 [Diplodia intermedia]|uniref:Uncharacterized protein n=1 Tax=Diplodia intermedia TaxID=856260 RepID=A0ABR3T9C3_9PEZI